ncbi:HAD family hydrolase [Pilimelia columellifera]
MPLMLTDLDNTLVDRDAAFRHAVAAFLTEHGLPDTDLAWIVAVDASGYTPCDLVASAMAERYGDAVSDGAVRALLDNGGADRVVLEKSTEHALIAARERGWVCVIVTNGDTVQQETKIRNTGLDRIVHGWVVSEEVGHKKPAPEIFYAAEKMAGLSLRGAWMIGDSPHADIAGAVAVGIRSVWVSNDRPWIQDGYSPTDVAIDVASAIRRVLGVIHPSR